MNNVQDKVVVITGASSGIGEATAKLLHEKGAKLVLGARRTEKLEKLKSSLEDNIHIQSTDVTQPNEVESLIQLALKEYGKVDVLINNAGIMPQSFLGDNKINEWNQTIDVNLKGVLYGIGAVIPSMRKIKVVILLILLQLLVIKLIQEAQYIVQQNLEFEH